MIEVTSWRRNGTKPSSGATIVAIDRPNLLGNPFAMRNESQRRSVIKLYEAWLNLQYDQRGEVYAELNELARRDKAGELLALQCWCAPLPCHGDTIKTMIDWINRGE